MLKYAYGDLFMTRVRVIGQGCQMNPVVLKRALMFALNNRPIDVERELRFAHGTAIRLCHKAKSLGLSLEAMAAMKPKELSKLYYAKKSRKKTKNTTSIEALKPIKKENSLIVILE